MRGNDQAERLVENADVPLDARFPLQMTTEFEFLWLSIHQTCML
jgi:hypothetical protein